MDLNRRSFIRSAAVGGVLAASGEAFAVAPVRGSVTAAGKPMAGVVVSDGLNCVETGADGGFVLPSNPKARFISVTAESCEPFAATESCDLRAVIHGHIHRNYFMRSDDGRLALISAAPPNKNDASIQIVRVSEKGDFLRADYRFDLEHLWKPVETPPEGGWLTKVDGLVYNAVPTVSAGNVYIFTADFTGHVRCFR